jgi:SAM-dependent methyltransferase
MLRDDQDAQGHALYDFLREKGGYEIIERDDGYIEHSGGPQHYFLEYDHWSDHEKEAITYVRGSVLDIGCGAGRHSRYLQEKGHDVLGIDVSPFALKVCEQRGLKVQGLSITEITPSLGIFDTIIMFGNNFGLFGSFKRARWLLRRFKRITSEQGRIIAETRDPYNTDVPEHFTYHEFNRIRGRMGGQLRLRVRYKRYATPWFDYLMVSEQEMKSIVDGTGWEIAAFIDGDHGMYVGVIEKE